ncbi:phospholipase D-like domain-containing protein [Arcticibacter sp. MXS-1]|uniref:phospholipase D-like domain-containing protein n=1 Tax=Arcticibacter sp. MXS-1 TaxID=3341726 RepID=UPI0035A997CE
MVEQNVIDQQVLHNNKEIYARLEGELNAAEFEILAAVSWFTDEDIFNVLKNKLQEGVRIEIVIADNSENEKLDFAILTSLGAVVVKIKNVGYGIMHQKFCVIDKKRALHGSYNWSVNARNNNHESIIITDHKETVQSLIDNFHRIKERAKVILGSEEFNDDREVLSEQRVAKPLERGPEKSDYEKVLDSMIAAEVSSFNRENLRQQGYDRAQANNGDHQVLSKALDTLYNGFINDIDVIEDKKRRLLAKIDEQRAKAEAQLRETCELQLETIEKESDFTQNNLNNSIIGIKSEILVTQSVVADLKDNKIPSLKRRISEIEAVIKEASLEFVKPGIKWFEIISTAVISTALFLYLTMFYSSAAYILLYSEEDALIAQRTSAEAVTPQVFNPDAIAKAADHGSMAVVFVLLFVFVPLTFAILSKIMKRKILANVLSFTVGVFVIDTFIAIKVAQAIHEIKNLTAVNPTEWHLSNIVSDINFYLVFIMGALGLILFKFCFEKISDFFDERNPDVAGQRNRLFIAQKKEDIKALQEEITSVNSEVQVKEQEVNQKNLQVTSAERELSNLPLKKVNLLESRRNDLSNKLQVIETTTDIYKSHIENDNVPVSVNALKDRINIFLEGWNDFLHSEYSITKASDKSAAATEVAIAWEYQKLNIDSMDARVKTK